MRHILGIDIGGTNIVAGVVPEDGSRILGAQSEPTAADQGADSVLDRIARLAEAAIAGARSENPGVMVEGMGIGCPGPLDTRTGVVLLTPNLGWVDMPVRDRLADRLGLPAVLDNDANCAMMGEWWIGAA